MESRHIRGDDDMFALLEEMGGGGGDDASSSRDSLVENNIINNFTMPRTLKQAFQLSPPSSPEVEIIRHRNHEKFKSDFYDLFRNCVPSSAAAAAAAPSKLTQASTTKLQESLNAERNQCIRSVLHPVWRQMPAHSIWERLQFSLKTLEAGSVRHNQQTKGQQPPWCCIDNEEQLINQLLSPSVRQIHAWTLHGKKRGIVWEPLLPVPAISSQDLNDQTNQGYRQGTFSLMEEEVKFQFIRSFKKCIGGGGREALPSVDKVYSTLKSLPETNKISEVDGVKKDDVTGVNNEKQAFILQNIFSSQPFKKILQKLHKKLMYLAEETYAHFLSDLKKCSDRKAAEEQQQMNKGRKRKGGKDKSSNAPKIAFIDEHDDEISRKNDADRQARVTFGGLSMKINIDHMQKLERLHKRCLSNIPGAEESSSFSRLLFTLLLRYDALEGAGLQSAIPHSVFQFLNNKFGCKFESFASPFNCYEMKQCGDSEFGSAFGDTDVWFGSEGSFFGVDFLSKGGCFQANPPFASEFMERMYQRMYHYLSMTNGDDDTTEEIPPIQFVIFVPAWEESVGWQSLVSSPYLSKHCLIDQKKHYYAEGTQHRRSRRESNGKDGDGKGSYRVASFDTSVFFLQNAAAKKKWSLDEVQDGLEKAFALTDEEEEKRISVKSTKPSQRSDQRQAKQATTQHKRKVTHLQPEKKKRKKGPAAKRKTPLISGGEDEMNIFNSLGLYDGDGNQRKKSKKA
ncbi:hypothetical protein ACHAXM_005328 [Skeletonema potamos]